MSKHVDFIMKNGTHIDLKLYAERKPSKGQIMGEDIRHAKAIYENRWGARTNAQVSDWLSFAKEVRDYLKLQTYQQVTEYLNINVYKY